MTTIPGYAGRVLHVDLTNRKYTAEELDPKVLRKYVGGTALGAKYLYEEVKPGVNWNDPENRFVVMSGPLGGTRIMGTGTFNITTKGALTEGSTSSQANGFLGAFLKLSGFDGLVIHGRAKKLSYLYIHDGQAELRECPNLAGENIWYTEDHIKKELGYEPASMSVFAIGPAGERLVRFAVIMGDRCHTASHNGTGAVMGSKNLKAIAVARGKKTVPVADDAALATAAKDMLNAIKDYPTYQVGTLWIMKRNAPICRAPFLNESIDTYPMTDEQLTTFTPEYLFNNVTWRRHTCWACSANHAQIVKITDGPLAGQEGKMPEYECFAALGTQLGIYNAIPLVGLSNEVDRLGMDVNETGWLLGMVMECYQKGILKAKDLDDIEMKWGDIGAVRAMINKIAYRQGPGDWLAEGVMRAARKIGPPATEFAIHTMAGNTPRTHDHRRVWPYVVDNATSGTGSSEANVTADPKDVGLKDLQDPFDPKAVATFVGKVKGISPFQDCLGACKFTVQEKPDILMRAVNAATGWDMTWPEAVDVGLRSVNLLRAFNCRQGYDPKLDAPSPRYGGHVTEGLGKGKSANVVWPQMRETMYDELGWDRATGKPKPETLKRLGLDFAIPDLWPASKK
ncbi:MAG: aldehyde ferredoxin oxidoreductase C-terminal domain-containing protein [Chloroflexota bacterium]